MKLFIKLPFLSIPPFSLSCRFTKYRIERREEERKGNFINYFIVPWDQCFNFVFVFYFTRMHVFTNNQTSTEKFGICLNNKNQQTFDLTCCTILHTVLVYACSQVGSRRKFTVFIQEMFVFYIYSFILAQPVSVIGLSSVLHWKGLHLAARLAVT